jgi:hypothetical protein
MRLVVADLISLTQYPTFTQPNTVKSLYESNIQYTNMYAQQTPSFQLNIQPFYYFNSKYKRSYSTKALPHPKSALICLKHTVTKAYKLQSTPMLTRAHLLTHAFMYCNCLHKLLPPVGDMCTVCYILQPLPSLTQQPGNPKHTGQQSPHSTRSPISTLITNTYATHPADHLAMQSTVLYI